MSPAVLNAESVTKSYRMGSKIELPVLKGVSLELRGGEFVAIMGSSGSGKSTLLHILGALDRPTAGEVHYNGQSVFRLSDGDRDHLRCRSFGFVFQFYHLLPELNVFENTLFPQMIRWSVGEWCSHESRKAQDRCARILTEVGLGDRLKHRPNQLSGGERQRVAIARALINEPAVLLADEPTGNLDKKTGSEVLKLLTRLHAGGQTIVMVTHDRDVAQVADRILRLEDGELTSAA